MKARPLSTLALVCAAVAAAPLATARAAPGGETRRAALIEALAACRKETDSAQRLACYDRAAAALDEAEEKGRIVVVDREQVRAVKRQAFGLSLPSLSLFAPRVGGDEAVDRVTYTITAAAQGGDGRWIFHTDDGASWVQTDEETLAPDPHPGSQLLVRHGALSSFFCKVDGQRAVRCQRRN